MSFVYLLHFDPPVAHARHYVGLVRESTVEERLGQHLTKKGSPLVRAAVEAGSVVTLVKTWPGDASLERHLKDAKNSHRHCPRCRLDYNRRAAERMRRLRQNKKDRERRLQEWIA